MQGYVVTLCTNGIDGINAEVGAIGDQGREVKRSSGGRFDTITAVAARGYSLKLTADRVFVCARAGDLHQHIEAGDEVKAGIGKGQVGGGSLNERALALLLTKLLAKLERGVDVIQAKNLPVASVALQPFQIAACTATGIEDDAVLRGA